MKEKLTLIVLFTLLLSSCVKEAGRSKRVISGASDLVDSCGESLYYEIDNEQCVSSCTEGFHIADASEIAEITENLTEDQQTILSGAKGACLKDSDEIIRPQGAVFINSDFCVCKAKQSVTLNTSPNCPTFCANKTDTQAKLYGSVTVGPEIVNQPLFGNLNGWCTNAIQTGDNPDPTTPQCFLTAKTGEQVNVTTFPGTNKFEAVLEPTLLFDTPYVLNIQETRTGTNAQSDYLQVLLKNPVEDDDTGIIRFKGITQYTCLRFLIETDNNSNVSIYSDMARSHFYFRPDNAPPALPDTEKNIVCFNYREHNTRVDNEEYPRLEYRANHFAVWDLNDPRMYLENNQLKANTLIKQEYARRNGGDTLDQDIFSLLQWSNVPQVSGIAGAQPNLGYIMVPFVDKYGFGKCPGTDDYNSTDPLYSVLKDLVGVPTEALYIAVGPTETFTDSGGTSTTVTPDVMFVRESEIKPIWFHIKQDGSKIRPTSLSVRDYTTYFYWPPVANDADPFTQKGYQKRYTVRAADDLQNEVGNSGIPVGIRPSDKRVACVPAVDSIE